MVASSGIALGSGVSSGVGVVGFGRALSWLGGQEKKARAQCVPTAPSARSLLSDARMGRPGPAARRRASASASRRSLGPDTSAGAADATHGLEPTARALESTPSAHSSAATGAGVLSGNTFAVSATGESQGALAALIAAGGGTVVKIVNSSVDYVVATPLAVRRRTQAVRKARDKFGVPLVLPAFIRDALAKGALGDAAAYEPRADAVVQQQGRPASSASLASLGLKPGSITLGLGVGAGSGSGSGSRSVTR